MTHYQHCSNCSAQMNKMAARAKNRKKPSNNFSSLTSGWIVTGNFFKNWRENSQQVNHWSNLSQMFLKKPFTKFFQLHNIPLTHHLHCGQHLFSLYICTAGLGGAVGCASDWKPGGRGFDPRRGRQHSFVEIDHEIFSTVILSLPLIQEGQLSVSGERMCTILVNRLED